MSSKEVVMTCEGKDGEVEAEVKPEKVPLPESPRCLSQRHSPPPERARQDSLNSFFSLDKSDQTDKDFGETGSRGGYVSASDAETIRSRVSGMRGGGEVDDDELEEILLIINLVPSPQPANP